MRRFPIPLCRTVLSATLMVASGLPALAQTESRSGRWEAELRWRPRQGGPQVLWIDFESRSRRRGDGGDFGMTLKASEFTGLAADGNRWSGEARFELRRDAGVIRFEGRFDDGRGEGTWRFEASDRFIGDLGLDGVADRDELFAMVIHDVRADWARRLVQSGVPGIGADDLIAMHIHGVTPEEVRELAELGFRDLSPDRLVALRIHGVSPTFIRSVLDTGLRGVDLDELVSFRIHKVDAELIREAIRRGARDADDVVSYRIHGRRRWR